MKLEQIEDKKYEQSEQVAHNIQFKYRTSTYIDVGYLDVRALTYVDVR